MSSDEELSFEEPKPWNEVPWVNSDNEPMGLSIKGKAKLFKTSSLKIVSLMKRRMRVFNVNGVKIKVIKHSYKKGALCCDIEVGSKDGSKEIIEATLFQPKGTIKIIRKPDVNPSYIELLRDVFVGFLDKFMSGANEEDVLSWSNRNPKHITVKTALSNCTLCSYETKFKDALKRHYIVVHPKEALNTKAKFYTCTNCGNAFEAAEEFKNHRKKCNVETDLVKQLNQRISELELIVEQLKEKKETCREEKEKSAKVMEVNSGAEHEVTKVPFEKINKNKPLDIPSNLRKVRPEHLPLLRGYKMVCKAIGNGACGTNCASIHTMEDDSEEAMKR